MSPNENHIADFTLSIYNYKYIFGLQIYIKFDKCNNNVVPSWKVYQSFPRILYINS